MSPTLAVIGLVLALSSVAAVVLRQRRRRAAKQVWYREDGGNATDHIPNHPVDRPEPPYPGASFRGAGGSTGQVGYGSLLPGASYHEHGDPDDLALGLAETGAYGDDPPAGNQLPPDTVLYDGDVEGVAPGYIGTGDSEAVTRDDTPAVDVDGYDGSGSSDSGSTDNSS